MLPLFDMMLRAQDGAGMEAIAKQFNLAQEQATQAIAALMPAFSSGFKRTAANPYDLTQLMGSMVSGTYAKYFEDMTKTFTPQGQADGNAVLEKLFGSKDVSRAIAQQAEEFTGIGQEIFKKMMPVMADALMGGLFKQMTGQMTEQMAVANETFAASPMGQMTKQWLEAMGLQPKAKPQPTFSPFDNPFAQAMRSMWGLGKPEQPQPSGSASSANPFADNPFAKAFQDMMSGNFAGKPAQPDAPTEKTAAAPEPNAYRDMLNNMFDSGLEVQKTYQKNMEAIFETMRNGGHSSTGTPSGQ